MSKVFFLLILSFSIFSAELTPEQLRFSYQSHDGQDTFSCEHKKINPWYDWSVVCGKKKFSVHLAVRKHRRQQAPKTLFEIMYWINNVSRTKIEGGGTTTWLHLDNATGYSKLTMSQATDEDTASLFVDINPNL